MKKVVIVLTFALFTALTFASYVSINTNEVILEKVEDEPKAEETTSTTSTETSSQGTTNTEKKACADKKSSSEAKDCSAKKAKSSCSKSCGGGN